MEKVRSRSGVPVDSDFTSPTGTPVVVDTDTGIAYVFVNGTKVAIGPTLNINGFGAKGDGVTDDTDAFVGAAAASSATGKILYAPGGDYVIKDANAFVFTGAQGFIGDGRRQTNIIYRPNSPGSCLTASNGASRVNQFHLGGLSFYSDELSIQKIAVDLSDISVVTIRDLMITGAGGSGPSSGVCWSGAESMGIRIAGREATGVYDLEAVCDRPIYVIANPNAGADENEDMDHFSFRNLYIIGNGYHCIELASGVGCSNATFDGYQAWVGGTGGFKMNDTRVGGAVIRSRHLSFNNVRHEQCSDANGYTFDIAAASRVEQIAFKNVLMSATSQGIKVDGYEHITMENVTAATAAGKNSLNLNGAVARSTLSMSDCDMAAGTTVTTTGLFCNFAVGYSTADYAISPSGFYSGRVIGSSVFAASITAQVATASTQAFLAQCATGDGVRILPGAAGSGTAIQAVNNNIDDFENLSFQAKIFEVRYRTGAATTAQLMANDASGNMLFAKRITATDPTALIGATNAMNDGAGAFLGTLATAPVAGNPTKWMPVDDGGTTRYIPAW